MRRTPAPLTLVVAAAAAATLACADLDFTTAVNSISTPIATPSWSRDLAPIIGETCARSNACHAGPTPPSRQNLEPANAYANLVNVPAVARTPYLRVLPGQPDSSFFYLVTSTVATERLNYYRMPLTEYPLPDPLRETIRNWISNGAPNN